MKFQDILNCIFPAMVSLLVTSLEHEKSFMMQESASVVWSIAIYKDSLLLTSSNDIVQKDIQTGAIQRTFRAHKKPIVSFVVSNNSRMISSAYDDMIIVWNLETGSVLKRVWLRSSETFVRVLYFIDDQVFAGGLDEKLRQVEIISGRVLKTICNVLCLITDL
jgi:WD40 repeat protein